ncbi:L-type lectin-domain containing receptor kinase IV.2 [Morella rubra]|uniref:non-specific serine/threonine protein kinase n=1 Tax=Morella rubra TaxID=262757 RepID=A0A6A1W6J0_9ROSI|nr:L-type lectin-domain containing receptor kinase IV.2 [Morella rubra]
MQVWVDYDGVQKKINVTLAPMNVGKPKIPLLSLSRDLSPIINDEVYVGFSASTGSVLSNHYVLGWSFKINGQAPELFQSQLPDLPRKEKLKSYTIALPVIIVSLVSVTIAGVVYVVKRKRNFAELLEDWELDYAPQRFKYKDLYIATKGFKDKELLGTGGFGNKRIYFRNCEYRETAPQEFSSTHGLLPAEGRASSRVRVHANGSLDKYLFGQLQATLSWSQRFRVLKGVASGLLYLHEEWEKVVVHRDVKASNVLLDRELNGRLGDFGLARLYDHGTDAQTTHVAGTIGYLAPENFRGGKPTTSTDVFAFGAFLLEVACGRKPIQPGGPTEDVLLVDWVFSHWKRGQILEARDPKLRTEYEAEELELVLKLGLLCSHSAPTARPSMRQIVQYLDGDVPLPEISASGLTFAHRDGSNVFAMTSPASVGNAFAQSSFVADSVLSAGR